jgi:hypothetical protein
MAAVRYVAYGVEIKLQAAWFLLNWITRLNEVTNCVLSDRVNGLHQGIPCFQNVTVSRNMLKWNFVGIRKSITAFPTPIFKTHSHAEQRCAQISSPNSWRNSFTLLNKVCLPMPPIFTKLTGHLIFGNLLYQNLSKLDKNVKHKTNVDFTAPIFAKLKNHSTTLCKDFLHQILPKSIKKQ